MLPVWVPAASEPRTGVTVTVPVVDARVSQATLSLAVQVSVPPPVLRMLNDWGAGLLPFCWAVKDKLAALTPMAGGTGGGVTVSVTETETG